jgi:transposase/cell division septum initiation protein DivIVA
LADELRIIPSFQVDEVLASHEGGMSKTYREWSPNQPSFFPPSPQDWLPEDDLVYFLIDTVATIDLSPIFAHYERERRGQPPFHPRMMVALLLYCYATGTRSSRKIMRRCQTDVACRVIVGNDIPDFRTISDFRKIHLVRLEALFVEVLKLCALAGLAKVGTISLDGTKVKANASRHKAMSYDRMQEEEKRLKQEIASMLAEAQAADATEDACHGPDRHGEELPEELARRQSRLAKIQQAKAQLEERARAEAAAEAARREAEGKGPPKVAPADAVPEPKAQINFTDPESRIMKVSNKGWDQCGNAQAVANEHQIILAADVTDQANDKLQAVPMVDQTRENLDAAGVKQAIGAALMDSGYYSETNTAALETRGIDPYVATERLKHHEKVASAPRGRIPKDLPAKPRMARKLRTKKGRELYAKRKGMIEPIFGQIKQVLGFRQFSLRGLASMRGEWRLMCVVHNLLKLWRHGQEVAVAG